MNSPILYILCAFIFLNCTNVKHSTFLNEKVTNDTTYHLINIGTDHIEMDGILDKTWSKATSISNLSAPWNDNFKLQTQFKALHNEASIYFYFTVEDDDIYLEQSYPDEESNAVRSDRVELFLRHPTKINPYYSFEMDAEGRIFDSEGIFGESIDESWDLNRDFITIETKRTETGYVLEGTIAIIALKNLGLMDTKDAIAIGIYRGNYHTDSADVEWISWVKPDSEKPNFHIPSSFGTFIFDK